MLDPDSTRHTRFRLAAALLPIAALAAVEVGLRASGFEHDTSAPRYQFINPGARFGRTLEEATDPDDELFWQLRPGFTGEAGTTFVYATGFRSDFATEPTPGVRRIACIGDSSTYGLQVRQEQTWSAVAAMMLLAEGDRAEVLNLGVPGYTSHQGLVLLRKRVLALQPDVVVCAFGAFNDWVPARGRTDAEQAAGDGPPALRVVQALTWLIGRESSDDTFELENSLPLIDTRAYEGPRRVDPATFEENLGDMIDMSRDVGAEVVLLASPLPEDTLSRNPIASQYAEATRRVGQAMNVPVVDGWALFAACEPGGEPLFADFCHPSPRGHAILGSELARVLAR